MVFWISCIAGLATVFITKNKKFIGLWVAFFNMTLSIYLSVTVTACIAKANPESFESQIAKLLILVVIAILAFVVIEFIASTFFTDRFVIALPAQFKKFANPVLSFFLGYLLTGTVLFLLYVSPLATVPFASNIFNDTFAKQSKRAVIASCSLIETFSLQQNDKQLRNAVDWLAYRESENNENPQNETSHKPAEQKKVTANIKSCN